MNHPETVSFIVQWPIQSRTPDSLKLFLKEVKRINGEMLKETGYFDPFRWYFLYGRLRLNWKSGLSHLHVNYELYSESESEPGTYKEEKKTFEIDGKGKNLSYGELLYHIQKNTAGDYGDDEDFNFPEELELSEAEERDGVPVYDLFVGS